MDNIACQLGRCVLQRHLDRIADVIQIRLDRLMYLCRSHFCFNRQTADNIAADDQHRFLAAGQRTSDRFLQCTCGLSADQQVVVFAHIGNDRFIELVAAKVKQAADDQSAE